LKEEEKFMAGAQLASYGSWKSPIAAGVVAGGEIGLEQVKIDGEDVYWIERRPQEGGRKVVVRYPPNETMVDVTPMPFNARTRVHEYGGGDFAVLGGTVVFANFADQRLYSQRAGGQPKALTPAGELRYADLVIHPVRDQLFCVREDHSGPGQPINTLVSIELVKENSGRVLVSGNDFYSSPRLSPDGSRLAWLTWNHPAMPWDGTELWVGDLSPDGSVDQARSVAGGPAESIFQPEWSPGGTLYFTSDRTGWWNLYRWRETRVEAVCPMEAEFGQPQWIFGASLYAFDSESRIICSYSKGGRSSLAEINTTTGALGQFELPYSAISRVQTAGGQAMLIAASATEPTCVAQLNLASRVVKVLRRSREDELEPGYFSIPQPLEFPTESDYTAHAIFYPPHNRDYVADENEKPPLLVMSHGGPTASTSMSLHYSIQYWTSRGIAVLDVNYRGSSGYGRAYRERLKREWGIVDVDDCVNGARYLAQTGQVDSNRLAIRGASAGGYTTLCALTFRDTFKAGASHYGISDLEALAKDTHKFESRYLDGLIGPYPELRDLYVQRSPIHFTERLACPMVLFQGLEDKIVPPNQAEMMFESVRAKGLPVAYLTFAGEQHGFRKAENIKRVLEAELYFYSKVFGFDLADPIEPIEIHNL
jgi:dipeptidyl aminopeptidase/acylaminoacyl peptidase